MNKPLQVDPERDLLLERVVDVSPELVWRAWTEPKLVTQWFTPAPWETIACEIDLRPGGQFTTTFRSPEGEVLPRNASCYVEVVPKRRLVWTDAVQPGWRPAEKGFMTAAILLEPEGAGTLYRAHVMHADAESRRSHEAMGFETGWGKALEQLVALVKTL